MGGGVEKIFIAIYSSHYRENECIVRYNNNLPKKKINHSLKSTGGVIAENLWQKWHMHEIEKMAV